MSHHHNLVPIQVAAGTEMQLYMRVRSPGTSLQFQLSLWQQHAFVEHSVKQVLFHSLYFGGILVIGLYNLFLYFSIRDRSYLFYVLYAYGIGLGNFVLQGYGAQFFWPNQPGYGPVALALLSPFYRLFMYAFVLQFLNLHRHLPWCARLLQLLIGLELVNLALVPILAHSSINLLAVIAHMLALPLVLLIGACLWRQGVQEARYFTWAWGIWVIGVFNYILSTYALYPYYPINKQLVLLAHLTETVLLAMALADRINIARSTERQLRDQQAAADRRTPMNGIFGGLQIAPQSGREAFSEPLRLIHASAKDMMRLINDILTYTEIQSGHLHNHLQPVAVEPLLEKLQQRYQWLCNEEGLELDWQVAEAVPGALLIDSEKLQTLLSKLLDNGVKFTEKGRLRLRFEYIESEKKLQICIEDDGIGMADTDSNVIRQPFNQQHQGFRRRFGGLGIGLAICHQFIEVMGGNIEFHSESEGGTCVLLSLPAIHCPFATEEIQQLAPVSSTLPILVVEDNHVNQKVMQKMLEKLGYVSLLASNGAEALELLEQHSISLVLMDLQMPVMDGFTCTEKICQRSDSCALVPIIAVTANLMDADKSRCLDAGMDDYIKKPIKMDLLQKTVLTYLSKRNLASRRSVA